MSKSGLAQSNNKCPMESNRFPDNNIQVELMNIVHLMQKLVVLHHLMPLDSLDTIL
jgi:hypothetical protein